MANNQFAPKFGKESLQVYSSNSLQVLAAKLADLIVRDPLPPLEQEVVLAQNPVMGRWLYLELAKINKGCANLNISLPNAYMHELFSRVLPKADKEEQSPFSTWAMTWRIMEALNRFLDTAPFTEIQRYLQDDQDGRKRFGLSRRLAGVFDRYLLFRPLMILNWTRGKGSHWQALLWREISRDFPGQHRPALQADFFKALGKGAPDASLLPQRISLFGVWGMPPFHLDVFSGIGRILPVYLFHVSPCRHYWAHAFSDRQITRITSRSPFTRPEELHLEKGNALLASLGGVGRDFLSLVVEQDCHPDEIYESPEGDCLLDMVKREILNFEGEAKPEKTRLPAEDRSIVIHSCHSPMREMEVLHDHILRFLEEIPGLEPREILVMAPDMDKYAPYVEAVFSSPGPKGIRIPYCIAHKEIRTESPGVNAFLEILELCQGRFEAVAVLDLAGLPPVAEKFGFSEQDLDTLARWVAGTRVRWGANSDSRKALGLPPTGENTWENGLDRLMLGYAMAESEHNDFFQDISPFDDFGMEDAPLLGQFTGFIQSLTTLSGKLNMPHTILEWVLILEEVVQDFLDSETEDIHLLQITLSKISKAQAEFGFAQAVSFPVVKAALLTLFEQSTPSGSILRRGLNFCSISQGTGIPSKVICLVGMDDGSFPRQEGGLGFDYMARSPRRGDRSPRNDDRFSFLQAILNAETSLYISYTGQGIQDNAALCPSPLVSELIDYVEAGFSRDEAFPLVTVHKLQAFDPDYFSGRGTGLFSYSDQLCEAAMILQKEGKENRLFFPQPLEKPEELERSVALERLCAFFRLPARFLLKGKMGIVLDEASETMESTEAFSLNGLERHTMAGKLVERTTHGKPSGSLFFKARAQGELPHGNVGTYAFEELVDQIAPFAGKTAEILASANQRLDAEVLIGHIKIHGRLSPLSPQYLFLYRAANIKAYDRLNAWIRHLFLCAAKPESGMETVFAGLDGMIRFSPVSEEFAKAHLAGLLDIFVRGMAVPVPFFPETSFAYAQAMSKSNDMDKAMKAAIKKWETDYYGRGDCTDSYTGLCFEGQDPLSQEFRERAMQVFGPMLVCQLKGGE